MTRPFVLGLTGSMGMGKTTTARMFADAGIPVWDADAAVHQLYQSGGAAIPAMKTDFPQAVVNGAVDRAVLRQILRVDPTAIKRLEAIVHPLTAASRTDFIASHGGDDMIVLDVPLLFETGTQALCDAVAVVSAPASLQRERILARGTMTAEELDLLLSRQMPDAEKRARADYVIETLTLEDTRNAVQNLITMIRSRHA